MLKRNILLILLLITTDLILFSQENSSNEEIEKTVDEQIWKPFKKAWEERDWKLFNNLHTSDVLRITKWGIRAGEEYRSTIRQAFQKEDARKRTIDFWMEHRIYSENVGYEVGYYRAVYEEPGKERHMTYAQFHVLLKKADGKWKIAQDWDASSINGTPVTAEDFAKGTPLDLDL